ncbi:hypothetical protein CF319_g8876 [Tilletia indica]|nr:hypothetical protein CF319_g8876 [Tilletia indica]
MTSTASASPLGKEIPFFSEEAARQINEGEDPEDDENGDVPTFASTLRSTFQTADEDAEEEAAAATQDEDDDAATPSQSEPEKNGRKKGAMKWNGLELRALLRAMDAHSVFDPTHSDNPDGRSRAWLAVVDDLARWNATSHVRKDGKIPNRTVDACEAKWRKFLLPRIKDGMKASEIATGPTENDEEEELTEIMERLKDQYEQGMADQQNKRDLKRKAKDPQSAKSLDARSAATRTASTGKAKTDADEDKDDETISDGEDGPDLKRRKGRGPAGATQLAGTVGSLAKAQVDLAEKERSQRKEEHQENREDKKEDRLLNERILNHQKERDNRQLDLEEKKFSLQDKRLDAMEQQVQRAVETSEATLAFLREKFN